MSQLTNLVVNPASSVREVMERIDRSGKGIALVLNESQHLIGTVTDGDIRRAILAGIDLNSSVTQLLAQRQDARDAGPLTAPVGTSDTILLHMMNETGVRQIPLVDADNRVVDVTLLSDLVKEIELPIRAVVMAGGMGTRLRPLTDSLPKPMLPIGSKPLLELIVERLKQSGIRRLNVATHYKSDVIFRSLQRRTGFRCRDYLCERGSASWYCRRVEFARRFRGSVAGDQWRHSDAR